MLLFLSLFSCVLTTVWSGDEKLTLLAPHEVILKMRENAVICGKQYDVQPSALLKLVDWTLPNDTQNKQFIYCTTLKSGYIHEDGHFIVEHMADLIPVNDTPQDFKEYLENCNKIVRENKLDTAFEMGICMNTRYQVIKADKT